MQIHFLSITHEFPQQKGKPALQDINLKVDSKEFVAIIGPSGCGKSTLLRLAANLLVPTNGKILIDQRSPAETAAMHQIAWMAQNPALLPWLTALENVELACRFRPPQNGHPLVTPLEALQRVGLGDVSKSYPFHLSGGMQQRLSLARLFAMDAQVWLMDEPFSALDELTRERLTLELFDLWRDQQPTVLWVTHNIYEAIRLADRIIVMSSQPGRILADLPLTLPYPRKEDSSDFQAALHTLRQILRNDANIEAVA